MVQIKWLREAKEDLKDIYAYISKDSEKYAKRQVNRIWERTLILKQQIRSGKEVEELNRKDVRELIEGPYRIIYRIIDEESVHILMIHRSSRDLFKRK